MKFGGFIVRSTSPELAFLVLFCSSVVPYSEAVYPVKPEEFPYFAVVISNGQAVCGATLYTPIRLLTACHCLVKDPNAPIKSPHELKDAGNIEVAAGFDSFSKPSRPNRVSRKAVMILVHPKCESNEKAMIYDYGMIEVTEPFELKKGSVEVRSLLTEKDVITETINHKATFECIALDFKITPKQGDDKAWDLGDLVKLFLSVPLTSMCAKNLTERKLDFDATLQVCSQRMRDPPSECGLTRSCWCARV
uniref:Kallikrein-11 n=1 Tax=Lygus hesperus TaxID=30085 RepID=A0A0A9X285_LYGHE